MRAKRTRASSGQGCHSGSGKQLEFSWVKPARTETKHPQLGHWIFVGNCAATKDLLSQIQHAAASPKTTVLITGESGTGKEVVAQAIHHLSSRSQGPFVAFNCAAVASELEDSELFGHVRGAFSGAFQVRSGLFESACGGTIFLDEIGEASPSLQAKLLRVIQERQVRRVGESTSFPVDIRIVSATNRDLWREVASNGAFRRDLFFRLAVLNIHLPPLRERREDISALSNHFLMRSCQSFDRSLTLTSEALRVLKDHPWPGNVRELENAIERAVAMAPPEKTQLDVEDIHLLGPSHSSSQNQPVAMKHPMNLERHFETTGVGESDSDGIELNREVRLQVRHLAHAFERKSSALTLEDVVYAAEREAIVQAMSRCGNDSTRMLQELGISQTTLWRKMKRFGLK